jgi:hypothetical protein
MADGDANGIQEKTAPSLNDQIVRQIEVKEAYGRKPGFRCGGDVLIFSRADETLWAWVMIGSMNK